MQTLLPNFAKNLAAHLGFARRSAAHQALRRGHNADAQPANHRTNVRGAQITARSWTRNALEPGDHTAAVRRILQENAQHFASLVFIHHFVGGNVAFIFQDARNLGLQPRRGHIDSLVLGGRRVADGRQKIGNGIRLHISPKYLPASFRDAGNFSLERHTAETNPAHLKLANVRARAATNAAAVSHTNLELRLLQTFGDFCKACHLLRSSWNAKREAQPFQELATFFIVFRGGGQGHIHALDFIHAGVIDFGKHYLIFPAEGVIAAAIESVERQTAKIAHAWQHHVAQPVEKFVHLVATQSHGAANRHAFADFKVGDRLLGLGDHGFLTGDLAKFLRGSIQQLGVLAGFAQADVHGDFLQLRNGHIVLPAKPLHQRRHRFVAIFFLQSTLHCLPLPRVKFKLVYLSSAVLQRRPLRTLLPSGKTVWPMRVCLPQLPQTTITLETLMDASFSTMPPLMFFCGLGRVWRFIIATCSTTTRFFFASMDSTRPLLPASLPAITRTLSPLRMAIVCRSVLSCLNVMSYQTSGAKETIFVYWRSRSSRATGPNTRVPTGSPAALISTAALSSKRMYVPSLRRASLRMRTTTAFTTVPCFTALSGVASFTEAVITSPSPAFNPASPPKGRMHISFRAPELSATVNHVRIMMLIALLPAAQSIRRTYYASVFPLAASA